MIKRFTFENDGQDFIEWYIDEKGVIVDSQPFQGKTWVGMKIRMHNYLPGDNLAFVKGGCLKHKIHSIRKLNKKEEAETIRIYKEWKKLQAA